VAWGTLHALYLMIERGLSRWHTVVQLRAVRICVWAATLAGVLFAWVFFRANSSRQALRIAYVMLSGKAVTNRIGMETIFKQADRDRILLAICVFLIWEYFIPFARHLSTDKLLRLPPVFEPVIVVILIIVAVLFRGRLGNFIYFQF